MSLKEAIQPEIPLTSRFGEALTNIKGTLGKFVRPFVDQNYRRALAQRAILHPAKVDLAEGVIDAPTFKRIEGSLGNQRAGKYMDLYGLQLLPKALDHLIFWTAVGSEVASGDPKFMVLSYIGSIAYRTVATFVFSRKNPELTNRHSYLFSPVPILEYFGVPVDMARECEAARYMLRHYGKKALGPLTDEGSLNIWANNLARGGARSI